MRRNPIYLILINNGPIIINDINGEEFKTIEGHFISSRQGQWNGITKKKKVG